MASNERIYWRLLAHYKTHQEATSDHQAEEWSFLRMAANLRKEKGVTQAIITTSLVLCLMEQINQPSAIHIVILISTKSFSTKTQVKVVEMQRVQVEVVSSKRSVHQHSQPHTISQSSANHHP